MYIFNKKVEVVEFFIFAIALILIDTMWLNYVMMPKYIKWFSEINMKFDFNRIAIVAAYCIMISLYPLFIRTSNLKGSLINALLLGFAVYGLYGFTVCAIFPKYGLDFALIETLWGAFLFISATAISAYVSGLLR